MTSVSIVQSLESANKIVMAARLQSNGPVLDKLRRISYHIETEMKEILTSLEN